MSDFVIGVTGHRFLTDVEPLRSGIRRAYHALLKEAKAADVVLMTGLADGADRLVMQTLLDEPNLRFHAVLPMSEARYRKTFPDAESRAEFDELLAKSDFVTVLPDLPTADAGYVNLARFLVERSDGLIALYDGEPAQGPGGTAEVVEMMEIAGKPVARVGAGNREPGTTQPTTLGRMQGRVSLRIPPGSQGK